jgi:hypothetical protein
MDDNSLVRNIPAKDVGHRIALSLRATLEPLTGGARIKLFNAQWDSFLILTLIVPSHTKIGGNLSIETGSIRYNMVRTSIRLMGLDSLYISWESPMSILFCFVHGDRFEHIKLLADTTIERLSGIDLRQNESKNANSEPTHKGRRTFYRIGDEIKVKVKKYPSPKTK